MNGNSGITMDRRRLMARAPALALLTLPGVALPALALGGCAGMGGLGGVSLVQAIQRLLSLSSQRAFAALLQPGGFYDNQVARIALPARLAGGGGLLTQLLSTAAVRDRLARSLNSAAERGAERAAPVVATAITSLSVADAMAIVRGGPTAATALLEGQLGSGLISAMFPGIGDALRLTSDDVVSRALRAATGYDVANLARDVADGANRGIWNAMGVEEGRIRANPQSTNDPLLIGVFGLAARG
ncbi:MAG: DUF4197 domain-containing protein [Sphingopyxis sp.]